MKYTNLLDYVKDFFGMQFLSFIKGFDKQFDKTQHINLMSNLEKIKSQPSLTFPNYENYPYSVREIFELYEATIKKEDIIAYTEGKLFKDTIVNLYLRILEKFNLIS